MRIFGIILVLFFIKTAKSQLKWGEKERESKISTLKNDSDKATIM
jgi:hypothetical protein